MTLQSLLCRLTPPSTSSAGTLLSSVQSPRDLQALPAEQMEELAAEIRALPHRAGEPDRRPPRTQPGRGRADPGHPPGLRLAARSDPVRHRAPELRAQDHHRASGAVPDACVSAAACPAIPAGTSPSTTGSRTPTPRPRSRTRPGWRGACSSRVAPAPSVAFVGDGSLTGGMAWEALNNIAADDDLPLVIVVNDNGRSYTPTVGGLARHLAGLRTNPRYEQLLDADPAQRQPHAAGRRRRVRPAARAQDRAQGRGRAAEHVLRPRPEVRRSDRRPRRARGGAGPAAGQAVRRPGAGALPDQEGQRLQGRRRSRRGPLPRGRQDRRPDRRGPRRSRVRSSGPTCSPRSCSSSACSTSAWWRSAPP